jgi:aldose 1-epimerase
MQLNATYRRRHLPGRSLANLPVFPTRFPQPRLTDFMQTLHLKNSRLHLAIEPAAGASISTFALRHEEKWIPVLRPTPPEAIAAGNSSAMSSFLLAPFSNRITGAQFSFEGQTYQLQANAEGGYAIHGCVRKRPWNVEHQTSEKLELSFQSTDFSDLNFPFPFRAKVTYGLSADTLTAQLSLTNTGDRPMPAGLGFHPYFQRTLFDATEKVELAFAASAAYTELSPDGPAQTLRPEQQFHQARTLPTQGFDTCFAGWDHHAKIYWPGSDVTAELRSDPALGHIILYTPPEESFFALEPVSHANNGFNLLDHGIADSGVQVLRREETLVAGFRLHLC